MADAPLILLSAGGTGGHVMPAQALAAELLARGCRVALVTDLRGKKYAPLFADARIHQIRSGAFKAGIRGKVTGLAGLKMGTLQSLALIIKHRPKLVIGFGGYPSVPAVLAAQLMKIPTIIHEQNAIIGKANAFLAGGAHSIALSLPDIQGLDKEEMKKTILTGNPVRHSIAALQHVPYRALTENGDFHILVMGGSLGARVFSEIVPKACALLPGDHKARLRILQQCREEDMEEVRQAYADAGINASLASFITDVAAALTDAHLFIGRSGASTVAELGIAGRPAIFVPYPHHKDQQQKMNANAMADAGGAWVMTENGFTVEALAARLQTFLQNPGILSAAAVKARLCGRPDATGRLADLAEKLLNRKPQA